MHRVGAYGHSPRIAERPARPLFRWTIRRQRVRARLSAAATRVAAEAGSSDGGGPVEPCAATPSKAPSWHEKPPSPVATISVPPLPPGPTVSVLLPEPLPTEGRRQAWRIVLLCLLLEGLWFLKGMTDGA